MNRERKLKNLKEKFIHRRQHWNHTLGSIEVIPNSRLTRLNGLQQRAQLHTARLKKKLKKARERPKSYSLINFYKQLLGSLSAHSHKAEGELISNCRKMVSC